MLLNGDCFELVSNIEDESIDLILIDPPYLISRSSNFINYSDDAPDNLKTKYGKLSIDFGNWDKQDLDWDYLFCNFYRVLKQGGTLIIFYDIWKSSQIKLYAEKNKFRQPRVCQWQKTNPVPVNSNINYLSNAVEYFFTFIKGKNPTFNSKYDNGVYKYPICHGKERLSHPTQKPISLIKDLIEKHSNVGDVVLDTFGGSGTTAHCCILSNRNYIVMENNKEYYEMMSKRVESLISKI